VPDIHFLPDDLTVGVRAGTSILNAAIDAGLPHAHACGGHARCSTCRVVIVEGLEQCGGRNAKEQSIAERLNCGPEIRLACQTEVSGDVTLRRLVLDPEDIELTDLRRGSAPRRVGEEKHVAVLFADIRGFTAFAETHLAYDVIHILRRLFRDMARVVAEHGGLVTTFMGDGFMALFGTGDVDDTAPEQAVRAGLRVLGVADAAEPWLEDLVGQRLEVNVGIHYGDAVVGTIHDISSHDVVTAIGDTVNMASRIEAANKTTGTRLLISAETLARVREHVTIGRSFEVALPGKLGEHEVSEVVAWSESLPAASRRAPQSSGRHTSWRLLAGVAAALIVAVVVLILVAIVR
jgi:adenylate cyclase